MLTLKSDKLSYGINLPTTIDEINKEVLTKLTEHINLPKYYAVVAICKRVDLAQFLFATSGNKKANVKVSVVPVLAKIGDEAGKDINGEAGDRIVMAPSDLERGDHVHLNTLITDINVRNYLDSDEALRRAIFSGEKFKNEEVYIVEFKIVPVSFIHGCIHKPASIKNDPFLIEDKESKD